MRILTFGRLLDSIAIVSFGKRIAAGAMLAAVAGSVWVAAASSQTGPGDSPFGERVSLHLDRGALRSQPGGAALVDKVDGSAFLYFRLLARQFAARTCYAFRDLRWRLPFVAVHGDPHIEQFVVTDDTYGLTDFDRAGFGPAVVDLVRYAASIHLACREAAWPCDAEQAVSAYIAAYRAALDRPVERIEPAVVRRVRAPQDRHRWFEWAEGLMQPLSADEEQLLKAGWARFVALMKATSPERPEAFYRIVRAGAVRIGIGSGLEPKTLIRIAGPTDASDDDLILEGRLTEPPDPRDCISRPVNGGSLQVLMFTALLARRLPEVFGFFPREGAREDREIWIQSWDPGHHELSLADLRAQTDLDELSTDAATQLAGHFWTTFPEPLRGHQRFAQLRALEMTDQRARDLAAQLARETVSEWERFRRRR
jgi:hypothetical protein